MAEPMPGAKGKEGGGGGGAGDGPLPYPTWSSSEAAIWGECVNRCTRVYNRWSTHVGREIWLESVRAWSEERICQMRVGAVASLLLVCAEVGREGRHRRFPARARWWALRWAGRNGRANIRDHWDWIGSCGRRLSSSLWSSLTIVLSTWLGLWDGEEVIEVMKPIS